MKKSNKFYKFVIFILKWPYKLLYHPKILGIENIPKFGRIIIAGNHKNMLDPCNVVISTKRTVHYMAKAKLFDKKIIGNFFRWMGCIKVLSGVKNTTAVEAAIQVLDNEEVFGIFPEGTRNKTNDILLPFKFGAVSIAQKTNSKIVPFGISGNYKVFGKSITVTFGKPIDVSGYSLEEANEKLTKEVERLIKNERYNK